MIGCYGLFEFYDSSVPGMFHKYAEPVILRKRDRYIENTLSV